MQGVNQFIQNFPRLKALWQYRSFVAGMVWREFREQYLGALFGGMWSIFNPMAMILIYTIIFSKIMRARIPGIEDNLGFGLFLCAGLLPWNFFSELMSRYPTLFLQYKNLIKKISFPKITLPFIILLSSAIRFMIIFSIFQIFLLITGRHHGWVMIGFIPLLMLQQSIALGLGIFLGTLNVFFRDVAQFVSIIVQFWFWFTPIIYPIMILPEKVRILLTYNPMTNIVIGYQQMILYGKWPVWTGFWWHILFAIFVLFLGFKVFRKLSNELVDEL